MYECVFAWVIAMCVTVLPCDGLEPCPGYTPFHSVTAGDWHPTAAALTR